MVGKIVKVMVFSLLICLIVGCNNIALSNETQNDSQYYNPYFFPMNAEEIVIDVCCKLYIIDGFEGKAKLVIRKLDHMKSENYYEMVLTDLQGECDYHTDINNPECEYSSEFPIGYFYVDSDKIYMMDHDDGYLAIFEEVGSIPPAEEYIEALYQEKQERGEHEGYFVYRLVCTGEGTEDTFTVENNYHEFIGVNDEERKYNFYPEEERGTQEHTYITWKYGEGITYYVTWSGNGKLYKSFWVPYLNEQGEQVTALVDMELGD